MTKTTLGGWTITTAHAREIPFNALLLDQVHGSKIVTINEYLPQRPVADGAVTNGHVIVGIQSADCLPLVVLSPEQAVLLHISRASLCAGLLDSVPEYIDTSRVTDVFIGPHICEKHLTYEYEGPELTQFIQLFPQHSRRHDSTVHLSLRGVVYDFLKAHHLQSKLTEDGRCTYEDSTLCSYRRWREAPTNPLPELITTAHRSVRTA